MRKSTQRHRERTNTHDGAIAAVTHQSHHKISINCHNKQQLPMFQTLAPVYTDHSRWAGYVSLGQHRIGPPKWHMR
ncbi:hypothetical protein ACB092_12G184500 [Castanea dentata]